MILAFSGNGNSFHVAQLLVQNLKNEKDYLKLQGQNLLEPQTVLSLSFDDFTFNPDEIIWVMPVYSWGVPPIMRSFIENIPSSFGKEKTHHLVMTCGDDIGLAHLQWKTLLQKKQWETAGAWTVIMPNTYTLMKGFNVDPLNLEMEKLKDSVERCRKISRDIESRSFIIDTKKGNFPWIKTRVIYPWFVRFDMSPRPFHATDRCISCGLCEEQCPTLNITLRPENDLSARPQWGNCCALCLRCYHHCPANAIQYGKATKGKGQYQIAKVLKKLENQ